MPCALNSYDCFPFKQKSQQMATNPNSNRFVATKLRCISNYKLRSESAHEEPKLRRLLGHISIYDNVRAWTQDNECQPPLRTVTTTTTSFDKQRGTDRSLETNTKSNECLTYYYHLQVPSFQDFQAAIEVQLATVAQVAAAAHLAVDVDEYDSCSDTDSDYDSYDGDWRDDEDEELGDGHESDGSLTDIETLESDADALSECSSPTAFDQGWDFNDDKEEAEENLWTLRPLTPFRAKTVHF